MNFKKNTVGPIYLDPKDPEHLVNQTALVVHMTFLICKYGDNKGIKV